MSLKFIWDPVKADENLKRRHISFEEATTVFKDFRALYETDYDYPEREIVIGFSSSNRCLFVVHIVLEEDDLVRIISVRKASPQQRRRYEEENDH